VDIYEHPEVAARAQVVAVPTIIRTLPRPERMYVGNLASAEEVTSRLRLRLLTPDRGA
jgi:hypothetical protein